MKPSTIPLICGFSLAALSAAGLSHWWSVDQFVTAFNGRLPSPPMIEQAPGPEGDAPSPPGNALASTTTATTAPAGASSAQAGPRDEFFQTLITEMKTLRTENRDLLDQMAETNRDLMKLEFRVDTHSESFRPLPVSEERFNVNFGDGPGVLPPRAEPVDFPFDE